MNWDAVGAIGEIVGALAVLITLGYLAYQVKQHTRATLTAANSAYMEAAVGANVAIAASPELCRALANWPEDPSDVSPQERLQVLSAWRGVFHLWAYGYRQYRDGTLDPDLIHALRTEISNYALGASDDAEHIPRANMLAWAWATERFIFTSPFQQFVDELLTDRE